MVVTVCRLNSQGDILVLVELFGLLPEESDGIQIGTISSFMLYCYSGQLALTGWKLRNRQWFRVAR